MHSEAQVDQLVATDVEITALGLTPN